MKEQNGYDYAQWGHQPREWSSLVKSHVGRFGDLPLGAVVASARLVDVVPIIAEDDDLNPFEHAPCMVVDPAALDLEDVYGLLTHYELDGSNRHRPIPRGPVR